MPETEVVLKRDSIQIVNLSFKTKVTVTISTSNHFGFGLAMVYK